MWSERLTNIATPRLDDDDDETHEIHKHKKIDICVKPTVELNVSLWLFVNN